jgi:hypothetical protein
MESLDEPPEKEDETSFTEKENFKKETEEEESRFGEGEKGLG